jgi:hypothetical protein
VLLLNNWSGSYNEFFAAFIEGVINLLKGDKHQSDKGGIQDLLVSELI